MSDVLTRIMGALLGTGPAAGIPGEAGRTGGTPTPVPPASGFGGAVPGGMGALLGGLEGGGMDPGSVQRLGLLTVVAFLTSGRGGAAGLRAMVERLSEGGLRRQVESWIDQGPMQPVTPEELGRALPEEALHIASRETGLRQDALLATLAEGLPRFVDRLTPRGRLPDTDQELPDMPEEDLLDSLVGRESGARGHA